MQIHGCAHAGNYAHTYEDTLRRVDKRQLIMFSKAYFWLQNLVDCSAHCMSRVLRVVVYSVQCTTYEITACTH